MKFHRRKITLNEPYSTFDKTKVPEPLLGLADNIKSLSVVLGEEFLNYILLNCKTPQHSKKLLNDVKVVNDLFHCEYEEDLDVDIQTTMAIVVIKALFPFNAKKMQSRTIDIKRFFRDFDGWPVDFKTRLEELLLVDKHLDNRNSVYLFNYTA